MVYKKLKSASKVMVTKGEKLDKIRLETLKTIVDMVGGTYGPGGCPVGIERYEHDLGPFVTKDGVTVLKNMGFADPTAQNMYELVRDASGKTARVAGDGTSLSCILVEALIRGIHDYCKANPKESPQRVARKLEKLALETVVPMIESWSYKPQADFTDRSDPGNQVYEGLARTSANGDDELAKAVIECFGIVGDYGNVSITEVSGPSFYKAEHQDGYPVTLGYEDLGQYYSMFINDAARQMVSLENPYFVVYFGQINQMDSLVKFLQPFLHDFKAVSQQGAKASFKSANLVIFATDFSDQVMTALAAMFSNPNGVKWYPIKVPKLPMMNGQEQYMQDLAAVTGAKLLKPFGKGNTFEDNSFSMDQLKAMQEAGRYVCPAIGPGLEKFEATRFSSNIVGSLPEGTPAHDRLVTQIYNVEVLMQSPVSEMDRIWFGERFGRLTNGIAKLIISGPSNADVKERRDRADDAICAVKGAIQHGVLPGGCWATEKVSETISYKTPEGHILTEALAEPLARLTSNAGLTDEEYQAVFAGMDFSVETPKIYDAVRHEHADPKVAGIWDSTQAILEAIRNSVAVAKSVGIMTGMISYPVDEALQREEASKTIEHLSAGEE